jgi:16S rRNA (cytidine1402-2'-O)-methyltransferase
LLPPSASTKLEQNKADQKKSSMPAKVYLIPIPIAEDGYKALPSYTSEMINTCDVFFAESLRTARRAFRRINKEFDIDGKQWHETGQEEEAWSSEFKACLKASQTIGIVSESGCPGIADPGQKLVSIAQEAHAQVIPLSGPSSILLALMASGMNGQLFSFNGYLPITEQEREKKIKVLDKKARTENHTQVFIETPYRNNSLLESLLKNADDNSFLCIASNITAQNEWIKTRSIDQWKKNTPTLDKVPTIFILGNQA